MKRALQTTLLLVLAAVVLACASRGGGPTLQLQQGVDPEYPQQAREAGVEGWVSLVYDVAADGSVSDVEVVAAEPEGVFDTAALEAVRRWRYRPLTEPVENVGSTLRFKLGEAYRGHERPVDTESEQQH